MPPRKNKLYTITVEDTTILDENDEHLSPDLNGLHTEHTTLESQEDIHIHQHTSFQKLTLRLLLKPIYNPAFSFSLKIR